MILTLIVIIVLLNFYVKKDLFLASIIGFVLFNIYLITMYDVVINDILAKNNIQILIRSAIFMIILYTFKELNNAISYTNTKKALQDSLDSVLKDKKLKFFSIIILAVFFCNLPIIGSIYLIFLAILLKISKFNMILTPILSILYFNIYYIILGVGVQEVKSFGIQFIIGLYILFLLVFITEKIRKFKQITLKPLLIDILFILAMFIINVYTFLIFIKIYSINGSIMISLIITWLVTSIVLNKFPMFIHKEVKETKEGEILIIKNKGLPYLTLFFIITLEIIGYQILINHFYIGGIFLIVLNILAVSFYKDEVFIINFNYLFKAIVIIFCVFINIIILKNIIPINKEEVEIITSGKYLYNMNILQVILNSQKFMLIPVLNIKLLESYITFLNVKSFLIIQIQVMLSLNILLIIKYVFSLKKDEVLQIITLLIIISIVLQIIVYLY